MLSHDLQSFFRKSITREIFIVEYTCYFKKYFIPLLLVQWQGNANYCAGFAVRELSFAFKEYCGVVYVYVCAEKMVT